MQIQPNLKGTAFENGYRIVGNKGSAVVGISLGNSYFDKEKIDSLLRFCAETFPRTDIMIPDKPYVHNYLALGYSQIEAERKARLNGATLRNHSSRAIGTTANVKILSWAKDIEPKQAYRDELKRLKRIASINETFRNATREATRQVIQGKLKPGKKVEPAIDEGIKYLLEELAFLSASPQILATPEVNYVYHNRWPIFEQFVEGKFDGKPRKDLGCLVVK
jgi:cyclo(L-tyrosyl-L-tyrosyl) synthase